MVLSLVGLLLLGALEYDPLVDSLIKTVSEDSLVLSVASLTGEVPVVIGDKPDSITSRYAYSLDSYKAALWLAEQLEKRGMEVELVSFIPVTFYDMDLLETGEGWACGYEGYGEDVFHTSDGGRTWHRPENKPIGFVWIATRAISKDSVWLLDRYWGITRMVDGESWEEIGPSGSLCADMFALNSCQGWVVGDSGVIISTQDAWETWDERRVVNEKLTHVYFTSNTEGWIASKTRLWRTTDGESWSELDHPMSEISGLNFTDSLHGYLIGLDTRGYGAIYVTNDGGSSWSALLDTLGDKPSAIKVFGSDTIWIATRGLLLHSTDGGGTWNQTGLPSNAALTALDFAADGRGCAVGSEEILYSPDSENWHRADTAGLGLMWNVNGTLHGDDSSRVLIMAHYDAVGSLPGADDDASGVSAVLEAARLLSPYDWKHTLKFMLFSGEEEGLYGSNRSASEAAFEGDSILAFLNVDMIGYDGNDDGRIEVHSNPYDPKAQASGAMLCHLIRDYRIDLSPVHHVEDAQSGGDHLYFWNYGISGNFFIEDFDDFNPFYHSHEDMLQNLNTSYMTEVTKASVGWMATMANLDSLVGIQEEIVQVEESVKLSLSSTILRSQGWIEVSSPYPVTLALYDAAGRRVKLLNPITSTSGPLRVSMDVSDLANGVYWIRAASRKGAVSEKFVVIR